VPQASDPQFERFIMLTPGDPAPWFDARSTVNPNFHFDTSAGRYVVLCFFGSAAHPPCRKVLDDFEQNHARFDIENACFCGVSTDPDDERLGRLRQQWPGMVYFWDFDLAISRQCGAVSPDGKQFYAHTILLDPALRTMAVLPIDMAHPETHVPQVMQFLASLPAPRSISNFAPVLILPGVFEPDFCRMLINLYEQHGGVELGFMRDIGGQTVRVNDHSQKRRTDYTITEPPVLAEVQSRFHRRVIPEIKKAYQFNATQIERYIISCYDSQPGGYFRAHRDDITKGTAHRRFAVSINLNSEEFVVVVLRFPEYGGTVYKAPSGAAVVFSCSLLHEVRPVIKGKRYAFLPFLYDEAAAKLRDENQRFVAPGTMTQSV